jgi:hypothetical protein
MPLGLGQQGPRLYLVCRYRGYDNERNLAQHRILSAEMSTLTFDRLKEFDLKKYDDDGRFGFGNGEKIRLTFRIERAAGLLLLETPLSSEQSNWMTGGWKSPPRWWIAAMLEWWLRGFADAVTNMQKYPAIKAQER